MLNYDTWYKWHSWSGISHLSININCDICDGYYGALRQSSATNTNADMDPVNPDLAA